MSFWTAAVVIVAILSITAARIARYRAGLGDHRSHRHGHHHGLGQALPSPREAELAREVEDLRDRIAVLERIATDANSSGERRSKAISDEIEALRDR